jgi:hypothetical protein
VVDAFVATLGALIRLTSSVLSSVVCSSVASIPQCSDLGDEVQTYLVEVTGRVKRFAAGPGTAGELLTGFAHDA